MFEYIVKELARSCNKKPFLFSSETLTRDPAFRNSNLTSVVVQVILMNFGGVTGEKKPRLERWMLRMYDWIAKKLARDWN
jgi:hypothetical protein